MRKRIQPYASPSPRQFTPSSSITRFAHSQCWRERECKCQRWSSAVHSMWSSHTTQTQHWKLDFTENGIIWWGPSSRRVRERMIDVVYPACVCVFLSLARSISEMFIFSLSRTTEINSFMVSIIIIPEKKNVDDARCWRWYSFIINNILWDETRTGQSRQPNVINKFLSFLSHHTECEKWGQHSTIFAYQNHRWLLSWRNYLLRYPLARSSTRFCVLLCLREINVLSTNNKFQSNHSHVIVGMLDPDPVQTRKTYSHHCYNNNSGNDNSHQ